MCAVSGHEIFATGRSSNTQPGVHVPLVADLGHISRMQPPQPALTLCNASWAHAVATSGLHSTMSEAGIAVQHEYGHYSQRRYRGDDQSDSTLD
jgi:hypothetical protein